MVLYEYEGKKLLSNAGISIPKSQLITSPNDQITLKTPLVLKAQVLSGKRAQAGGIIEVSTKEELSACLKALFGKVVNREKVEKVLAEEKINIKDEYYLSLSYDTNTRSAVLTLSDDGGTGIEDRGAKSYAINPLDFQASLASINSKIPKELITKITQAFFDLDALLLEINPLVETKDDRWVALDAKIKLDDYAKSRHEDWQFAPRGVPGYTPTDNEIAAKRIDEEDYRGTAGSAYFDLPGDIAILSSGGGVSLTAMDALVTAGGKPANFTEYSGNPPKEKVVKLTKIVLSKPNIHGLWVIGTVVANFTDIYETLSGLIDGLREAEKELKTKFNFPIVIRRGGPRDEEAYRMLRQVRDFHLYLLGPETSINQAAQLMVKLAEEYAGT